MAVTRSRRSATMVTSLNSLNAPPTSTPSSTPTSTPNSTPASTPMASQALVVAKPLPSTPQIFQTFTTKNVNLEDGVCVIRNLGGGKYEIVNLSKVQCADISSEETGRYIKSVPGRRAVLDVDEKAWEEVKLKCHQSLRSADSDIFRFLKLPIELRYKVYDYVLTSSKSIRPYPSHNTVFNTRFIRTCRQIRDEGMPFLFRNNLSLSAHDVYDGRVLVPDNAAWTNLKEISYDWWGYAIKDKKAFEILARLPQLKILHVLITSFVIDSYHHRPQKLHQTDDTIKAFRRANGFDQLVQIRGLERVTVGHSGTNSPVGKVSKEKEDKFQVFLNDVLTQPKPQLVEPKKKAVKAKKVNKTKEQRRKAAVVQKELQRELRNLF